VGPAGGGKAAVAAADRARAGASAADGAGAGGGRGVGGRRRPVAWAAPERHERDSCGGLRKVRER
jgi:hypothetical protein